MNLISIDIGYTNMAIVHIKTECKKLDVINLYKIDLHEFNETQVHKSMLKFIEAYKDLFKNVDLIIIERQPPQGLTNIQDILAYEYSDKVILICPRSMHKHFYISKLDYESRKKFTTKIADKYLKDNETYKLLDRKHDIADAFCLALYYNQTCKSISLVKEIPQNLNDYFDSFRYIKALDI